MSTARAAKLGVTPLGTVVHFGMPTSHPRHAITETEDIADALGVARRAWPDLADKPGALLRRLILEGRNAIVHSDADAVLASRQAVSETGGALTGVFGVDYLKTLREDWPE
ncbi:hypothetical protein TUM20985_27430 [Mycobacterium antarcticum]|uniref:hypothetical protein n=1 Tax=unclassified Mycolicibacterium TaxID=2636767 RepID=UPI00239ED2D5|nr:MULTISPECIES: hypothetical protein [unclassified Mycolicibacterium]BDX32196.1 hypothetical protein TUM20985_27430 [Mycolicibacterium sp. TUM20985]GLP75503.1 hypothetical protein TUM20983_26130 [Mycolicibacterium sp. TUM20983]GLP84236.1 hypothetical protein TUM20984_56560 [Mycolicibacterium sp. TUM20984]